MATDRTHLTDEIPEADSLNSGARSGRSSSSKPQRISTSPSPLPA